MTITPISFNFLGVKGAEVPLLQGMDSPLTETFYTKKRDKYTDLWL
jgi:hypothetical protein